MLEIVGGGRGIGNTFKELLHALEELDKLKVVNELLLAQKMNLENENARLKADMKEIANRDLQIEKEADALSNAYKEEHEKFKCLLLLIKKARAQIDGMSKYTSVTSVAHYKQLNRDDVLEILDKLITESEVEYEEENS